ncbi:MAG: oligosaccharide flippase family protein [Sedimentisphaerales bacterium]|nr:oligosaccharide flippase family protein [Sedimentisphaerales bacterium]
MKQQSLTTPKRLVHNTFFNVAALLSNALVGFFLIRFFLSHLGEAQYGVWLLIGGSIYRYAPLLSLGLNSSVNRYIPLFMAQNNDDGIQRVFNTSLFFFITVSIVLVIISFVVCYNISSWFAIEPEMVKTAGTLVLIVGFCSAFAMPMQSSTAILSGMQRYDIVNAIMLALLAGRTILIVILLRQGYGLLTIGTLFGLSEVVMRIIHSVFVKKLLPDVSLSLTKIDLQLLKEMMAYGINTFMYAMGAIIIYYASSLIIGIFIGTAEVSQFNIATAGVLLLSQLLQAFTAAIKPAVTDLDARNNAASVKEIAFLTQKYSLLLIIPGGCFLIAMGREFLDVWVSDQFTDPSIIDQMAVILTILTVGHCLRLAQHSNFLVLVGRGQHKIFGILTALMALFCVLASIVSARIFHWGLIGIAWSNFLPMALTSVMILPIYFNRKMHISTLENIRNVWQPALLGSLPAVVTICIWKYMAPPNSWIEIVSVVLTAMVLTVTGGWFLSLKEVEKKRFIRIALPKK